MPPVMVSMVTVYGLLLNWIHLEYHQVPRSSSVGYG